MSMALGSMERDAIPTMEKLPRSMCPEVVLAKFVKDSSLLLMSLGSCFLATVSPFLMILEKADA